MHRSRKCPECNATGTIISGPKRDIGLCVSCKSLVPILHTRIFTRRKILRATLTLIAALGSVSSIDQEIRVWLPQRHDEFKEMAAYIHSKNAEGLALIAADQAAHPLN